ncbi:MAG: glycosyltransferase family A protein [Candidatus Manganitrophus sp.]|nr:glycosyltransferase family A protein [Candidatus Manganitrophus sp.]
MKAVAGRVSLIVPSGSDAEALLATMTSLAQKVQWPDWEVVIVVNDEKMKPFLPALSGDLRIVEANDDRLPFLYNRGAEAATGDRFIFMKPGVLYIKGVGFARCHS